MLKPSLGDWGSVNFVQCCGWLFMLYTAVDCCNLFVKCVLSGTERCGLDFFGDCSGMKPKVFPAICAFQTCIVMVAEPCG